MADSDATYVQLRPAAAEGQPAAVDMDALADAFARRFSRAVAGHEAKLPKSQTSLTERGCNFKQTMCDLLKGNALKVLVILATIATSTFTSYLINNSQMQGKMAEMQAKIDVIAPKLQLFQVQLDAFEVRLPRITTQLNQASAALAKINATLVKLDADVLAQEIRELDVGLGHARAALTNFSGSVKSMRSALVQAQSSALYALTHANSTIWANLTRWSSSFQANMQSRLRDTEQRVAQSLLTLNSTLQADFAAQRADISALWSTIAALRAARAYGLPAFVKWLSCFDVLLQRPTVVRGLIRVSLQTLRVISSTFRPKWLTL